MQRNSVVYILGFCAAVCLVCSLFVSSSAVGLKPQQDANKLLDRQKKVLVVSGLMEDGADLTPEEVGSLFDARIKSVVVDLATGLVDESISPADFDQRKAQKDPATSKAMEKNRAGVARVPNQGLVFLVSGAEMGEGNSGFALDQYIFPVEGKGLWSTLYGFVAMAPDCNEIKGLTFYAHGETPGLGGEVDNPRWKAKWPGKLAFADLGSDPASWGEPTVAVVKTGGGGQHKVDALSGATITSNGVTHLLRFWLGERGFGPYIKRVAARPAQG
jgi:Na+-transporting NADH:ubiquinone oxidoreductase subunit C